jgi:hypothetical protein
MRRTLAQLLVGAFTLAAPLLAASTASAAPDPAACGSIDLTAQAECTLVVQGGCDAACEPLQFTARCYGQCDGGCSASASVDCSASCQAGCSGRCDVDPGSFECKGSCEASCNADCSANCSASGNEAQCQASCKATCSGECDISCQATPPSASCEAKCEASCSGSCTAEANFDCQVDCQGECSAELSGGCEVQCESPKGALFCDGSYLDVGDKIDDCLEYLGSIGVEVQASGNAECVGNTCTAEGEASVSCAAAPGSTHPVGGAIAAAVVGVGLAAARRRKRA